MLPAKVFVLSGLHLRDQLSDGIQLLVQEFFRISDVDVVLQIQKISFRHAEIFSKPERSVRRYSGNGAKKPPINGYLGNLVTTCCKKNSRKNKKYAKKACNEIKSVLHSEIAELHRGKTQ